MSDSIKLPKELGTDKLLKKLQIGKRSVGRPADWFRKLCGDQLICKKGQAVLAIGKIARGEATVEKLFQNNGQIIRGETSVAPTEIVQAASFLADRAFGKAHQTSDITSGGKTWLDALMEARGDA